jgi:3-oxoacyl-[acyl-carrier-protein] synthase-3
MSALSAIGVAGVGVYLPDRFMTSQEISELSGIPAGVIEDKMGIVRKPIPGEDDHSCEMGIKAARKAIADAGIDAGDIDLVIYIGEEHKEYPVWTAALRLQEAVGARNAWAFDMALRCSTTLAGLKIAKNMMIADEGIRTVLLAGGYRNVDLIDYTNPRTRFMYNLSAGGGAIVLRKGMDRNVLLDTCVITDGSFSEDVIVPAGGTKRPLTPEALEQRLHYLDVPDPEAMKERLESKSMDNFLLAIRRSLHSSGYTEHEIGYVGMLHMKKSAHDFVLSELGLRSEQSVYLREYGHVGQFDQMLSLQLGLQEGKINDGDIVVLVSAGIGYAWSATTIRWGSAS